MEKEERELDFILLQIGAQIALLAYQRQQLASILKR